MSGSIGGPSNASVEQMVAHMQQLYGGGGAPVRCDVVAAARPDNGEPLPGYFVLTYVNGVRIDARWVKPEGT